MFLSAASAHAFVKVCHHGITTDALDTVVWPSGAQSPALTRDQALLEGELTIDVAPQVTGFWQLSMLVGNQFSDGGSYDAKDVVALAEYTALPDAQSAHCLRAPSDDDPTGNTTALASCKAFILGQIDMALGPGEVPDVQTTETVRLHLVFRGNADIPLDRYAFHMGRATHAVQDAFTHMFRSPDLRQVRSVLNWVDWIGNSYDPARDGFQHILALDSCGSSDVGGVDAVRQQPKRRRSCCRPSAVTTEVERAGWPARPRRSTIGLESARSATPTTIGATHLSRS